jgi:sulfur relay (sulfurtransferase) DsrC/TusE family protein
MEITLTKNEAWRILDSIVAYRKDYDVAPVASKAIKSAEKKIKKAIKEEQGE